MAYLILVRHGESRWNIANKFTGWIDVPLSEVGIHEALITAKRLQKLSLDIAFTSELERAQETLLLILASQDKTGIFKHQDKKRKNDWYVHRKQFDKKEIPIHLSEKLNERYYGDLQGLNKDDARRKWGKEQVHLWRRSYDIQPPKGESLKDVVKRAVPHFKKNILPHVKKGKNVIISAHGNSLRAIIKHIDGISDEQIPNLELQTGVPIIYKYIRGKLVKETGDHTFDRPTHWKHHKRHQTYKTMKKKN
ncbi:MAG: 2,3-bisphosphoglycerate-dependent phosphoglycerate mutase [Nanoarchaeota archaeon]|nr:2,3-bisphosphoglycerate-dependent phosphoglycerate mutase [Nanoarchaeota archaeon]